MQKLTHIGAEDEGAISSAYFWSHSAEAGKMAGSVLRACTALAEDFGLGPSNHIRQLATAYNSSSRVSGVLFWPL